MNKNNWEHRSAAELLSVRGLAVAVQGNYPQHPNPPEQFGGEVMSFQESNA